MLVSVTLAYFTMRSSFAGKEISREEGDSLKPFLFKRLFCSALREIVVSIAQLGGVEGVAGPWLRKRREVVWLIWILSGAVGVEEACPARYLSPIDR